MWEIVNAFHCRLYLLISCIVTLWAHSSLLNVMHFRPGICMFQYWWCNVAVLLAFPKWHPWPKAFTNLWKMFSALIISWHYVPFKTIWSTPDSCKFDDRLRHPRLILCLAYYHTTKALFVVSSDDEFFLCWQVFCCAIPSPQNGHDCHSWFCIWSNGELWLGYIPWNSVAIWWETLCSCQ